MINYYNDLVFCLDRKQLLFLKSLIRTYDIKTMLDLACGYGCTAISMARWGLRVTAVDSSLFLVQHLREKVARNDLEISVLIGDMRDIGKMYHGRSQLAICLGNSLFRLLGEEDIWGTLAQIYLHLLPGGMIVIHTLNYDYLIRQGRVPVVVAEKHDRDHIIRLFFEKGIDDKCSSLIFRRCLGERTIREEKMPVLPVPSRKVNIWLAELGFKGITNYHCFGAETNFQLFTIARRP
ncbi:MAG TPA: class I SAM-dependent methyltransferase [Firmicutes bacterium]|jgi:cyclopropane fatty-acyl-phospholipid synthase-like methyltransferase|nr:class I SAM-dependent methyltransferase [Bacillota bacterium]